MVDVISGSPNLQWLEKTIFFKLFKIIRRSFPLGNSLINQYFDFKVWQVEHKFEQFIMLSELIKDNHGYEPQGKPMDQKSHEDENVVPL